MVVAPIPGGPPVLRGPGAAPGASLPDPTGTPAGSAVPWTDRLSIEPLDLAGALQILATEIRGELARAMGMTPATSQPLMVGGASVVQAPHVLLEMFLTAVPGDMRHVDQWASVATRVEDALRLGLDRGVDTVAVWRNTSTALAESVREVRAMVITLLDDEPVSPLWLRPEWLGLAPVMRRYWRRRRIGRRPRSADDGRSRPVDDERFDEMS